MLLLRVPEVLDVISVCTLPADRVGLYLPQVPGAEFGLGVRWRLVLTSTGVPGRPLGTDPLVVIFNLGRGSVQHGHPVAREYPKGIWPRAIFCFCKKK